MNNEKIVSLLKKMIEENTEEARLTTEEISIIMKKEGVKTPHTIYEKAKKLGILNSKISCHKGAVLALSAVLKEIENE